MSEPTPGQDQRSVVEAARQAQDEVHGLVEEGRVRAAERALHSALDEALPELPLRFAARVVRLNDRRLTDYARALRDCGQPPALLLADRGAKGFSVEWCFGRLGWLAIGEVELLRSLGTRAGWYRPRLVELIEPTQAASGAMVVELVRPEMRVCSSCGNLHAGPHLNCDACRKKRRRTGEVEQTFEPAPVALTRALEHLAQESADN